MRNLSWLVLASFVMVGTGCPRTLPVDTSNDTSDTEETGDDTEETGDDTETDDTNLDTSDEGDTIYDIQNGTLEVGTEVSLYGVVALTPPGRYGFYAGEPGGGAYSGVYVFAWAEDAGPDFAVGDLVNIASGTIEEYPEDQTPSTTEVVMDDADLSFPGGTAVVTPTTMELTDFADDGLLLQLEGTLVTVAAEMTVTSPPNNFGEWVVNGNYTVGGSFYAFEAEANATLTSLTGVLVYSYGEWKIELRSDADVGGYEGPGVIEPGDCETADKCAADLVAGDLMLTEVQFNPQVGDDAGNEWFEIRNTTAGSIDLNGVSFYDDTSSSITISTSAVVAPGDYFVISNAGVGTWAYTTFIADYTHASSGFGLGNSGDGDYIQIKVGSLFIDEANPLWNPSTTSGYAWQLSSSVTTASGNDTLGAWCAATTAIETVGLNTDYGTPGAVNVACPQ